MTLPALALTAAALLALALTAAVQAGTVHVVTERGNVFSEERAAGASVIDGLGVSSRLVHRESAGTLVHASSGSGLSGSEVSVRPYVRAPRDAPFAFVASDAERLPVPRFYSSYSYSDGALSAPPDEASVLRYSSARTLSGSAQASQSDEVSVSGEGRVVLRLEPLAGASVLWGELSEGTSARLAFSPYDLMALPHESRGFLLYSCSCDPGPSSLSVESGSVPDSARTGSFEYDRKIKAEWYVGKCCRLRYTTETAERVSAVPALAVAPANDRGYLVVTGDRTEPQHLTVEDVRRPWSSHFQTHYNEVGGFAFGVYDTLPVRSLHSFEGRFEERLEVPAGAYLVVDSAGGTSHLRARPAPDGPALLVTGAPPDTGYRVVRGGMTLAAGISSDAGRISVPAFAGGASPGAGGELYLYPDSPTHVRKSQGTGTVVFDVANGRAFELDDGRRDSIYVAHAYAKIPVTGAASVSGVAVGPVGLPYLAGEYRDGDSLMVPVVPAHRTVSMSVNGAPVSLEVADVLGGTGLKIAGPASSTVSVHAPGAFADSVEATAGAVSYMVAHSDGHAKAHVRASVAGSSEITNTRFYQSAPPPPPPPAPRDPLTAWLRVYVNGEPVQVGGRVEIPIFFSDSPVESHESGSGPSWSRHTARFSYPPVDVFKTVAVPVEAADFVEFYFYSRVRAEGSAPPVAPGLDEIRRDGRAEATSVIRHASIHASM